MGRSSGRSSGASFAASAVVAEHTPLLESAVEKRIGEGVEKKVLSSEDPECARWV
jgi:hypothetical protein